MIHRQNGVCVRFVVHTLQESMLASTASTLRAIRDTSRTTPPPCSTILVCVQCRGIQRYVVLVKDWYLLNFHFVNLRISLATDIHLHCFLHPFIPSVVDVEQGQILCIACGDYVYDSEIRRIAVSCKEKARRSLGLNTEYRAWAPDSVEMTLLQAHPKRRRPTPNSTIGLVCSFYLYFSATSHLTGSPFIQVEMPSIQMFLWVSGLKYCVKYLCVVSLHAFFFISQTAQYTEVMLLCF